MNEGDWKNAFRLDGEGVTLVLAQRGDALPEPIHWGAPLPADEDLPAFAAARRIAMSAGTLDTLPPLTLLPEEGRSFQGAPGIELCEPDGRRWLTAFRVTGTDTHARRFTVHAEDHGLKLTLDLAFQGPVLTGTTTLRNEGARPILLARLTTPVLPLADHCDRLTTFSGHWIGEFKTVTHTLQAGQIVRESRVGRTSHEHSPAALALTPGSTANEGEMFGAHLGWSGGHLMCCEELPDGRRQLQFAPLLRAGEITLDPGESFTTPTLHAVYSRTGRTGIARAFQSHVRTFIGNQTRPRPVTCNSWEAIYFAHDLATLSRLADEAAALGAERFVLDDGWFGNRDDDTTSLGDWTVDPRKWPDGLDPFVAHVNDLGMEFGIWFEPEMVNRESELFAKHPDWMLADPNYPQLPGRNQFVLDLGKKPVRDHLFDAIGTILSDHA
ncbi:MAG: alpha-galactosidase, partial [Pseudomonadota bacterium]